MYIIHVLCVLQNYRLVVTLHDFYSSINGCCMSPIETSGRFQFKILTFVLLQLQMTLETAESVEDLVMSADSTAYIITTIALLGGVLAFYYCYIYNNPEQVVVRTDTKYFELGTHNFNSDISG